MSITLTRDQQAAFNAFAAFITDPIEQVFVIEGYSGTGKSTLVKTLLAELPTILKAARLIHPSLEEREVVLTATTNKACEALALLSGQSVRTIHSFLGLRVHTDYRSGKTTLKEADPRDVKHDLILFIDEASFIDSVLLSLIFKKTRHCKIVFIGDPAQLLTVGCTRPPVFHAGFTTARLTEVVRHDGPILELATKFRETVETGQFFRFIPDGTAIRHLDRAGFEAAILAEFNRPDWSHHDSKVLAWTNKKVIAYNQGIANHVTGTPEFQEMDYAVCNRSMQFNNGSIKTDETVCITHVGHKDVIFGVPGTHIEVNHRWSVFLPDNVQDKKKAMKQARDEEDYERARHIDIHWIDLRPAYACTLNKSQGSTYDSVFIDLDDLKGCNSGDQIARMLYVGISRARQHVYLTGDIA